MRRTRNAGAAVATLLLTLLMAMSPVPALEAQAADVPALETGSDTAKPHRHYTGLAEHFQAANLTHDGKLTLAQAGQDGWRRVVLHFDEIDSGHAGYVTAPQIHAYNASHRHRSRTASAATGD